MAVPVGAPVPTGLGTIVEAILTQATPDWLASATTRFLAAGNCNIQRRRTTMASLKQSLKVLGSIAAIGGMVAAMPATSAFAANPCGPKAKKASSGKKSGCGANPCAANPCAAKKK
jgi:hypothetical protein